jgi:hypothetical protein
MAVRANISKGYIWRPGVIGAAALFFSIWFLYDGTVKYPLQQEQSEEYARVFKEITDPTEAGRAWEQLAIERGWPTTKPTQRTDTDIRTQKILAGITGPVGLYFLATFLMGMGRWIEADEQAVRTRSGQETRYDAVTSIDKSRWKTKGIAVVHYESNGQAAHITLDDWKFEREPTKRILEAIEQRMPGGGEVDDEEPADAADEPPSQA